MTGVRHGRSTLKKAMNKPISLLPCPFCGGRVRFNHNVWLEPDGIWCESCHCLIRFPRIEHSKKDRFEATMSAMADAWNRRDVKNDNDEK